MELSLTDALIVVDIQNDFCESGAIPHSGVPALAKKLSEVFKRIESTGARVVAIQDWHTEEHISFVGNGGKLPQHCIQGSEGARLHKNLRLPIGSLVVRKGADPKVISNSAFAGSVLEESLRRREVSRLLICGVQIDGTVLDTGLDARSMGFEVVVVQDEVKPSSGESMGSDEVLGKMKTASIGLVAASDLV